MRKLKAALLGLQWGDEGKGKVVDVLTPKYDVVARFQGGPNAGHTLDLYFRWHAAIPRSETQSLYHIEYISDDDASRDCMKVSNNNKKEK